MIDRFKELSKKYYYNKAKAEYAREWIEKMCVHVKGEWDGKPFKLLPFQWEDIIQPVFGLYESKAKNARRLIKECYIEIPKKNGKTTLLAAVELFLLFGDGEPGAEVYNCAGDDSQANLLFRTAKLMIASNKTLKANSKPLYTEIRYKNSLIKKLTSKADTKHGLDAHGVIYDELHAATDNELYDTLKYAGAQRRNSIFFQITTAGYDKASICWDRHDYTLKVNSGSAEDDHFWGLIYAAKESDPPFDPKTWEAANPIYKHNETFQKNFAKDAIDAQNNIRVLNAFKRLRLNIWTGGSEKWFSDEDWMKGDGDLPDLTGKTCFAGVDLASTSDTAAVVLLFPVDDMYYLMPFIFVPERMIHERDKRNETFYFKWDKEGFLIRTPGNVIDYQYIRGKLLELRETYDIHSIGYDPYNATQLMLRLQDEDGFKIEPYRQGYPTMSAPTKEFEKLILSHKIVHGGHPVLRWMADNAQLRKDTNDNYMIGKTGYSTDKVDGMVAAVIALGEAMKNEFTSELKFDIW